MKNFTLFAFWFPLVVLAQTDPPELAAWLINTTGATGYNGIHADVDSVQYSDNNVYVRCSGIPAYNIGPWGANPNRPANQNYLFRIPRQPVGNTGAKTNAPLGHIGVWKNGVAVYNPLDAISYNNQNIWHQNAIVAEARGFDLCLGHPAPGGRYHHHQNPRCLYSADSTKHSPILGYAFDGFPIYGPYAYANVNGGGIKRMRSSYRMRNITQRQNLPDGTMLNPNQYGPNVSATYPLGFYAEDFEYVQNLGDLDEYNVRFAVTPEYPQGTYAYYVTIDPSGNSAYPYVIGPQYYGVVAQDNFGNGRVTINEPVKTYRGPTTGVADFAEAVPHEFARLQNFPNPFSANGTFGNPTTMIRFSLPQRETATLKIFNIFGQEVKTLVNGEMEAGEHRVIFGAGTLPSGVYFYQIKTASFSQTQRALLIR